MLTDTLLDSPEQATFPDAFKDNIQGRQKQDATPMTVVISNPPWSSGQDSAGDDNPNLRYEDVSSKVGNTYGVKHQEVTGRPPGGSARGNLYIKALRWCTDRILPNAQRDDRPAIIGMVHPNSLADGTSLAGVRAMMREEFTDIYVVNLRGNAYKSGDEFRKEGDKIFGGGSRNGVQITFLVRNPSKDISQPANLHYAQVPDYMSLEQKWKWLEKIWDVTSSQLEAIPVNPRHDWVNLSDGTFDNLLAICDTQKENGQVALCNHASGVKTNCDTYVYSFSREMLIQRVKRLIDVYDQALDLVEIYGEEIGKVTANTRLDAIKWTDTLKGSLRKGRRIVFDEGRIREVVYRPFTKLWLYEDDLILSSVKTVSAMFPLDQEVEAVEVASGSMRGASDNLSATGVAPDLNQWGGGQGFSRGGDSDSEPVGDVGVRDAGGGSVAGFVREGPGPADEGGAPSEVTGGGGWGNSHHLSFQQGGLRDSRNRGHQRSLRGGNAAGVPGRSPAEGLMVTGPSNMAREGVLATGWLPDLHTMAAGQQTRVIPRRR